MKREKVKSFFMGVIVTLLICTMIVPAIASTTVQDIRVTMGGIKIYVDGNIQTPVDANGNKVEPLMYNGTTYLPVRAVTNMLTDKEVSWDQQSMSVYIGKQPTAESTPIDQLKPYNSFITNVTTEKDAQFEVLDETITPFNRISSSSYGGDITYMLKSNYSSINGKFIIPYTFIPANASSKLEFYSVDEYGSETLLKSYETKTGDKAVDVNVNTLGVEILKIKLSSESTSYPSSFYNVTLSGL
jgi:hypothetical protein